MPAEPTVPVATLEKLWRRLRQLAGMARRESDESLKAGSESAYRFQRGVAHGWRMSASDLRAIIDEAKGETR